MTNAIVAEGLVKRYGDVIALDGLDLAVEQGTVVGLLGPNGAGKTTTVRILTTLLEPDEGRATVNGLDAVTDARALRRIIGLSGQNAAVDEHLTGFENLDMVGRLYHLGRAESRGAGPRAARAVRPRRGRRPAGEDLLRGHAAPARPGRRAGGAAAESCSSTSRRPASTRAAGWACGTSSATSSGAARRCC